MVTVRIAWCPERGEPFDTPQYATPGAAGFDFRSAETLTLQPMERRAVPTGFRLALPEGYELQIRARSGLASRQGLTMVNGVGTIDADYRGEVLLLMINLGTTAVTVQRGDRVAQGILSRIYRAEWEKVEGELDLTERGEKGFGSSGVR